MAGPESSNQDRNKRLRHRNLALLAVLVGLIVVFYLMTIVQFGSHSAG